MKYQTMTNHEVASIRRFTLMSALLALFLTCFALQARAQGAWKTVVVDPGGGADVGQYSSLVVDRAGNIHIGYYDATRKALWYSFQSATDKQHWFRMPVDAKGVGAYNSLAVDRQGHPHFTWVSPKEDGLHYANYDGKFWHKQIVDNARIDYYNSIQLDANDHPRISYYQYHNATGQNLLHLKYAYFDGKAWYIQTVDQRTSTGKFNSLAVDAAGNPHIAYAHVGLGDLLYAHWDGSSWQFSDADSRRYHNSYVGIGNSIAVDSNGYPHIAYFDASRETVKYAHYDGKKWTTEVVNQLASRGELDHVSIKLDANNMPHIAFYDAGSGVLKYAVRKTPEPAAGVQPVAAATSDKPGDKPEEKVDDPKKMLTLAGRDQAAREKEEKDAANWNVVVVDKDGNVGMTPSLCLDSKGVPYISYYDVSNHALKLAYFDKSATPPPAAATAKNAADAPPPKKN